MLTNTRPRSYQQWSRLQKMADQNHLHEPTPQKEDTHTQETQDRIDIVLGTFNSHRGTGNQDLAPDDDSRVLLDNALRLHRAIAIDPLIVAVGLGSSTRVRNLHVDEVKKTEGVSGVAHYDSSGKATSISAEMANRSYTMETKETGEQVWTEVALGPPPVPTDLVKLLTVFR